MFAVSKFIGKSKSRPNKRSSTDKSSSSTSTNGSSFVNVEKDAKSVKETLDLGVIVETPPSTRPGTPIPVPSLPTPPVFVPVSAPEKPLRPPTPPKSTLSAELDIQPTDERKGPEWQESGYDIVPAPPSEQEWTQIEESTNAINTTTTIADVKKEKSVDITTPDDNGRRDLEILLKAKETESRKELARMAEEKGQLEKRVADAQRRLTDAHSLLKAKDARIGELGEDLGRKEQMIGVLEKKLEQMQKDAEQKKTESWGKIRGLDEVLEKERNANKKKVAALERENEALKSEIEVGHEQIVLMEGKLVDSEGMANDLRIENARLKSQSEFQEEELVARRARSVESETQVSNLEMDNNNLSAQLIHIQEKVDASERQNRVLLEHVRQQADQAQTGKEAHRLWIGPLTGTTNANKGATERSKHEKRVVEAVKLTKVLNEEIYQLSASMADHVESIDKRFVEQDFAAATTAAAVSLKSMLGTDLLEKLKDEAPFAENDLNPFFVQTALQGCLIACCMHIITSWYPAELEYGGFLAALYERIRGIVGWQNANYWRVFTLQGCGGSSAKHGNLETRIVAYLKDHILKVLRVSGWDKPVDVDGIVQVFEPKLLEIAKLAVRLNEMRATPDVNGQLEPRIVETGDKFWNMTMGDDNAFESDEESSCSATSGPNNVNENRWGKHFGEPVICTVGLGLDYAKETPSQAGAPGKVHEMLLKPRVLLRGALF